MAEQEPMDRALDMAEQFAAKLEGLAVEYGPEVADVTLAAARIDALSYIIPGIFIFAAWCIWLRIGLGWARSYAGDDDEARCAMYGGYGVVSVILFIVVAMTGSLKWLSPWPWVGLIEPKLWIAHKVLGL